MIYLELLRAIVRHDTDRRTFNPFSCSKITRNNGLAWLFAVIKWSMKIIDISLMNPSVPIIQACPKCDVDRLFPDKKIW